MRSAGVLPGMFGAGAGFIAPQDLGGMVSRYR